MVSIFPYADEIIEISVVGINLGSALCFILGVVKHTYSEEVTKTVEQTAMEHQECLDLANHLRPAVKQLVSHQRSDYGFSETTSQFPVTQQAANIDQVPAHNLPMESYCGADAVYIEKRGTVEAASRRKLFKGTQHLVKDTAEPLSAFRPQLQQVNPLLSRLSLKIGRMSCMRRV